MSEVNAGHSCNGSLCNVRRKRKATPRCHILTHIQLRYSPHYLNDFDSSIRSECGSECTVRSAIEESHLLHSIDLQKDKRRKKMIENELREKKENQLNVEMETMS